MDENDFVDFTSHSSGESSLGWVPIKNEENTNSPNQLKNSHPDISSDTSTEYDAPSISDIKSFKERIIIKKERFTHQLSDEESKSPSKLRSKNGKILKHTKLEEGQTNDTLHKICVDGTLDTNEGIPFNLDSDDEVWIVQCPANIEPSDLKGIKMGIGGVSTIGANYMVTTLSQKTYAELNINLLIPNKNFELKAVPVAGQLVITQKVDVPPLELPAVKNKIAIPLPEGLKLRHPLLGFVNSNSESFDCDAAYIKHNKRKKKHKHIDSSQTTTYSDSEISPSPHKKKKKKKKELSQSESIEMAQNISKEEKDNEFEDVIESSQATNKYKHTIHEDCGSEMLFPLSQYFDDSMETNNCSLERKKKKKKNKYDITESPVQDESLVTPTHHKKKKRKSDTDDSISLLNTSVSKKSAKKYVGEQELKSQSRDFSPERLKLKRRHSGNEADSVSPKKKKFKLSHSQDRE